MFKKIGKSVLKKHPEPRVKAYRGELLPPSVRKTTVDLVKELKSELSPLYDKYGILLCPHCRSPLLTKKTGSGKFRCVLCNRYVGRLSEEIMMKMLDDFPKELLREWVIEMKLLP